MVSYMYKKHIVHPKIDYQLPVTLMTGRLFFMRKNLHLFSRSTKSEIYQTLPDS